MIVCIFFILAACSCSTIEQGTISCDKPQLYNADEGLKRLSQAIQLQFQQIDRLQKDIKELKEVQTLAKKGMEEEVQVSFTQVHSLQYLHMMKAKFESLSLIQMSDQSPHSNMEGIKQQIDATLEATDPKTRKDCCQMLSTMIESLIVNLLQQQQNYLQPITITIEEDNKKIQITRGQCDAITLSIADNQELTIQNESTPLSPEQTLTDTLVEGQDNTNTFVSNQDVDFRQFTQDDSDVWEEKGDPSSEPPNPYRCDTGESQVIDIASDSSKRLDFQDANLDNPQEYGYSYWFRYLTRYPKQMYDGKKEPWYFMSRLTGNKDYKDIGKGDRLLAIWQGQSSYAFITNDYQTSNWNVAKSIQFGDIEGVWTFIYFSYSSLSKEAVGFLKYSGKDPLQVNLSAMHSQQYYLRLVIGGPDLGAYPAINGQMSRPIFKIGPGAHLGNIDLFSKYAFECSPEPVEICSSMNEQVLIPTSKTFDKNTQDNEIPSNPAAAFPSEYSVSGWFRWAQIQMQPWHLIFRLHINKDKENRNVERLGDRALAAWISPYEQGIYSFSTYTYNGVNGAGNPNLAKNIPQRQQQTTWHFIFYAYSRTLKRVEGFMQFSNRRENIVFENVYHFLAPQLYLNLGKDRFHPAWSGQIGKFRMNLCSGAFRPILTKEISIPPQFVQISEISATENQERIDDAQIVVTQLYASIESELPGEELQDNLNQPLIPVLIGQNQASALS